MKRIGITSNILRSKVAPIHILDRGYFDSVAKEGALPIILPILETRDQAREIVENLDGLLISGGIDIAPFYYNENPATEETYHDQRDAFEKLLFEEARKIRLPILGICRGMQLTNILLGGSLISDIKKAGYNKDLLHVRTTWPEDRPEDLYHKISLEEDSQFYKITGEKDLVVNSIHHQAIGRLADGLRVVAKAADGIIEAVEEENYPLIAFQFHPERGIKGVSEPIFKYFIQEMVKC